MNNSKDVVLFTMDTMRNALLHIANVPFADLNKNMSLTMRAIARGALKQCADKLKLVEPETEQEKVVHQN